MSDCNLTSTCPFFNDRMSNKPATAELIKSMYCKDDFNNCARMVVAKALGRDKVPVDLLPSQAQRALEIVTAL
ncbi:MAG: hypothetical protein PHN84_11570 [Desulfuromonadaceae bacterium]|nr:hypothetical protein [Desulfuromonadaceae bacterium]MDD2854693.1 hypothetical protein [Desulfuromonadaceae bacterium]